MFFHVIEQRSDVLADIAKATLCPWHLLKQHVFSVSTFTDAFRDFILKHPQPS
jgi:hypothetical protein